jgi:endonuclease/exonuclease/phosphatase family metal-dependent hydrolase
VTPNPSFFSSAVIDSGLLIISKLKIVEHEFLQFDTVGVGADILANKGCLYAKIDLKKIGGNYLHLYTMHTQASYLDHELDLWIESYKARYCQFVEARNFINSHIKNGKHSEQDISILCGDFNVDSTSFED